MTEKEKEKLREIQLNALDEIQRICKKNNIKFFLGAGTCLGAVRHNGFIPWDDDVDIIMMRNDYDKFIKACETDLSDKYFLQNINNEEEYVYDFSKIRVNNTLLQEKLTLGKDIHQGIWIDIFPHDYTSNNKLIRYITQIKFTLAAIIRLYNSNYPTKGKTKLQSFVLFFVKIFSKCFSRNYLKKWYNKNIKKHNKKTNYITHLGTLWLFKPIFKAEMLDEAIMHKFENRKYPIPKEYDAYLSQMYGDYMTPPPVKTREIGHGIVKIDFNTKNKRGID